MREQFVVQLVETSDDDVDEIVAGTVSIVEELLDIMCYNSNLPRIRVHYPCAVKTFCQKKMLKQKT